MNKASEGRWHFGGVITISGIKYVEIHAGNDPNSKCIALVRWDMPESLANAELVMRAPTVELFSKELIEGFKAERIRACDAPRMTAAVYNLIQILAGKL